MGIKIVLAPRIIRLLFIIGLILQPLSLLADSSNTILIFRAFGDNFAQTSQGIKDDLGGDFAIIEKIIEHETSISVIANHINNSKPTLIALIGNIPARLYTHYQKKNPNIDFPPSVVMSALYVDRLLRQIKNAQGIRHEVPAVTSIVNIRSLLKKPVRRVGVLYRKWMRDYIKLNAEFCKQEGIELVAVEIPNAITVKRLSYHLKHLINKDIDALWVANDNALISPQLIQNAWIPNIKQFNKNIIVGIENLTSTSLDFGTFAVVSDQYALGIQAAGLITDIIDEGSNKFEQKKVYEPISVKKSLNTKLLQKRNILVNPSQLDTLDKIIDN
ncbi:MAG: ABC transporter substrate binding protein [Pseudomonadota bacterium]